MHFNTKYIFYSDTKEEIGDKINYNFDQIISFGVGPDGHIGPRGATGLYGPAGYKGPTGSSGIRASKIFKQPTQPVSSETQPYDVWVDNSSGEGDVNVLGPTGNWDYSGYSFFTSSYFSTYSWILGPAGSTDKYVVGIKDTANAQNTNLVISDGNPTPSVSNPNNSKLLVATQDQTTNPIFTFSKTGSISSGVPSFYWETPGSNRNLIYRSTGDLDIVSKLGISVDSGLARTMLFGNNLNLIASSFTIGGSGDFQLASNTTIGSGGVFNVQSQNLLLSSAFFTSADPFTIYAASGNYVLNNVPSSAGLNSGIVLTTTSNANDSFSINDLTGNPILSGKPSGAVDSGKHSQTIFGSTGGYTGGTAGPFSYHVRRASQVNKTTSFLSNVNLYPSFSVAGRTRLDNVFDLSDISLWDSNVIVVTPTSYTTTPGSGTYLRIPASYLNSLNPVYNSGRTNIYRILLNTLGSDLSSLTTGYIKGFIFSYTNYGSDGLTSASVLTYFDIPSISSSSYCQYVDLHWLGVANSNNLNPRLFYKACNGVGGYVDLTNLNSIGSEEPITSGSSPTSGPGDIPIDSGDPQDPGGGSFFNPYCPTPDMLIYLGEDNWISAGNLRVNDEVYTIHEQTGQWGYYRVSSIERAVQTVISTIIGNKVIKISEHHKFLTLDGEYTSINDLEIGSSLRTMEGSAKLEAKTHIGDLEVVKIEIENAHTYVLEGVISHNVKITPFIDPNISP
jgi:hypothetical protein